MNDLLECQHDPYLFFGNNPAEKMKQLRIKYHPDRFPGEEEKINDIIRAFQSCFDNLTSEKIDKYRIVKKIGSGDLCDVFLVHNRDYFVLKRARVKNPLLKKEKQILEKLKTTTVYGRLMPNVVDNNEYIVYNYVPNLISGTEVYSQYKDDLNGRHLVWMFKRICMIMTYIHSQGYVHGAITPDHTLFNKKDHGMILCDWIHTGKIGDTIQIVPAKWKHFYPAETIQSKKLTPQLDIYMAAQTMLYLGGKNINARLKRFFESCLFKEKMRPDNADSLHEEMVELSRNLYGNSKFIEL